MDVQVTVLSQRGSATMRRSWRVNALRVRFGRGTGNEVPLPDIRVDLIAAAMFLLESGSIMFEALGPSPVRFNGANAKAVRVSPGDEILIGPYQVQLDPPPPGCDAALTIQLVQPLGDSLDRLRSHSRIGLERVGFSKRRAAWIGFLTVLLVCLAVPIALYSAGAMRSIGTGQGGLNPIALAAFLWKPGELSNSHRFFAADCTSCHRAAFTAVADQACLGCHQQVGAHIEAGLQLGGMQHTLAASRCTDCHEEHRGARGLVVSDMRLCLGCHRSLAETTPAAGVPNVGGFPGGHPQFRATVVENAAGPQFERVPIGGTKLPMHKPGIKFSHAAHLVAGGFPALGYKPMECRDCHVLEPSGQGFQAVTYKQQCAGCHALDFDRQELPWPSARVPHGDDTGVAAAVWNFYAGKALQGAIAEAPAPAVTRRVPGAPVPETPEPTVGNTRQWVADKTEVALRTIVLDDKRGCAYCHFGTGRDGAFEISDLVRVGAGPPGSQPRRVVAPVVLRTRFLPQARFDHAKHAASACERCHDARNSEAVGQMLIPGIQNCAECHGTEGAALHAQSTCITCHRFHSSAFGPMHSTPAAARR